MSIRMLALIVCFVGFSFGELVQADTKKSTVLEHRFDIAILVELSDCDSTQISELIQQLIAAGKWNGNRGRIQVVEHGDAILIKHEPDVIDRIADLLAQLERSTPGFEERSAERRRQEVAASVGRLFLADNEQSLHALQLSGRVTKDTPAKQRLHGWVVSREAAVDEATLGEDLANLLNEPSNYSGGEGALWLPIIAGMSWAVAMHAYSAVPDIWADREAGYGRRAW